MTAENSSPYTAELNTGQGFTESDRILLREMHGLMTSLIPYLPLLERAARLLERNPAARWRQRHAVPQDREG